MKWNFQEILTKDPNSAWGCDTAVNIPPCGVALRRTCRCTEFHRVKNANLPHPSCTVVMQKRKSASPVLHSCNAKTQICFTRPQCVKESLMRRWDYVQMCNFLMSFSFISSQHNSCMQISLLKYTPIRSLKFYKENNHWTTRWRCWLRQRATSRQVADSIPLVIIGIFHWYNPASHTMAMMSTRPQTEMSARNIFCVVKAAGACGWPYHFNP